MVNGIVFEIESVHGAFIASTDSMTDVDQAALRRFDPKVTFGFLRPEQAWGLSRRHPGRLGLLAPPSELVMRRKPL